MKLGLVASTSACVLLCACASVTRGSSDAWEVNSDPIGAKVETTNGHYCDATPCAIRMSRKSEFVATVTKPGYKPATISVTHKTAKAGAMGMAGNVLIGGLIGVGVDSVTGATQDLVPNPAFVKLEPAGRFSAYDRPSSLEETVSGPPSGTPPLAEPAFGPPPAPPPPPVPAAPSPTPPRAIAPIQPAPLAGGPPPVPPAPAVRPFSNGNAVKGQAFLRTVAGQTRSCAGSPVRLFPVNPDTEAFVRWTFGSPTGGFSRRTGWEPQPFDPIILVHACDAQGAFAFDRLPDGEYFVAAVVSIETQAGGPVSYVVQEGGTIATRVSVMGGAAQSVLLTR